jgi:hypothetical protein
MNVGSLAAAIFYARTGPPQQRISRATVASPAMFVAAGARRV